MQRRRVLIDALSLTQGGGSRSYLVNLLRELGHDSRGFAFTVLADSDDFAQMNSEWVEVVRVALPAQGHPGRVPLRVAYEQSVLPLRARNYDLLYCPADLAPVLCATPVVVALRNMHIYDQRFYQTLRLKLLERLVRLSARRARRVVFPSRAAADRIRERVAIASERVAIVHHGVSPESFAAGPRRAGASANGPAYLFLPASIERHKRIEVLIQSLAHTRDEKLEAWIAGTEELDPTYASELRELAESLGLASRVRFLGPVPYREVLDYYRGAVALAFPSNLETFGQPMLEAMLAETPIIAADIPSFREIGGDIALYFPPDDAVALARAADAVRTDDEATRARVARGRARAAEFSWKRSVDQLCGVFEDVLGGARATGG